MAAADPADGNLGCLTDYSSCQVSKAEGGSGRARHAAKSGSCETDLMD